MLTKFQYILSISLLSLFIAGCGKKPILKKKVNLKIHTTQTKVINKAETTGPRVTVWVHGTKNYLGKCNFIHALPTNGMTHVSDIPKPYQIASAIKSLSDSNPIRFPFEHCHVFGWPGTLSFKARQEEAQKLYTALTLLSKQYEQQYGTKPNITLITHSHGGNVVLNLARIKNDQHPLSIANTIILACPVQHETKELINNPLFGTIYAYYSAADMQQILDPQGLYITEHNQKRHLEFSGRMFPMYPNVRQAKLRINGHGISHVDFTLSKFTKFLPGIVDETEQWEREQPSQAGQERLLTIVT